MEKNHDMKVIAILGELERYRQKLETGELYPGNPDHVVRMCQAHVATYGNFEDRAEWIQSLRDYEYIK